MYWNFLAFIFILRNYKLNERIEDEMEKLSWVETFNWKHLQLWKHTNCIVLMTNFANISIHVNLFQSESSTFYGNELQIHWLFFFTFCERLTILKLKYVNWLIEWSISSKSNSLNVVREKIQCLVEIEWIYSTIDSLCEIIYSKFTWPNIFWSLYVHIQHHQSIQWFL